MNRLLIALIMICVIGGYQFWTTREISHPPGVLAPNDPVQVEVTDQDRKPEKYKTVVIEPLAKYKIQARILGIRKYWLDRGAKIAPYDLALGWGPMSDSRILKQLDISQADRFFFYSFKPEQLTIAPDQISNFSANVHIIPDNAYIKQQIAGLHVGNVVTLTGSLVRVNYMDGGEWKSSLTRSDTGNGACELMKVDSIVMNP
jgi:hypothetical protein